MTELSNTRVHTDFKEVSGNVEITGNIVIGKGNEITSIIAVAKYDGNEVCNINAWNMLEGKLNFNLNNVNFEHLCDVIPVLEGIEASVLASIQVPAALSE
jgi:hypothetical protein